MSELAIQDTASISGTRVGCRPVFWLRAAVGVLLIVLVLRMIDFQRLAVTMISVDPRLLALALMVMAVNFLLKTYRWSFILQSQRPDVTFRQLARLNFISLFLGNFLPSSISYDIVRVYYVAKRAVDPRIAISSIFADRLVGQFSIALTAVLAFAALKSTGVLAIGPMFSFGIVVFLLLSLGLPLALCNVRVISALRTILDRFTGRKLFDSVQDFSKHLLFYGQQTHLMITALGIALLNLLLAVFEYHLIAAGFSAQIPLGFFFLFIPLVIFLSMLPVSVSGIGLVEGGLVFFFSHVGMAAETCLSLALLHRALQLVCVLPGGAVYVLDGKCSIEGGPVG
jgi:uncharacterized protein (TIRG00374 family)